MSTPEKSKYNGHPPWDFAIDDTLLEEGEVRIYEGEEADEPIAVVETYEEAITVCNAVNRLRDGHVIDLKQFVERYHAGEFGPYRRALGITFDAKTGKKVKEESP